MPSFEASSSGAGQIFFEQHGARANPPVLLIHGLGCQLIQWPPAFIEGIVQAGLRVVVFDNRGIGLSSPISAPAPSLEQLIAVQEEPASVDAAFTLADMAADTVAVLDHVGQAGAHIIGVSMGGMIAQHLAATYPNRVHSLTCIMSSSGNPALPGPDESAVAAMVAAQAAEGRDAIIEASRNVGRINGGPHFDSAEHGIAAMAEAAYDRSYRPEASAHQLVAIAQDGDRRELLKTITAPTLVIHGTSDPLVPHAAGEDIAANVPNSELVLIDKLGHDLSEPVLGDIVGIVARHIEQHPAAR